MQFLKRQCLKAALRGCLIAAMLAMVLSGCAGTSSVDAPKQNTGYSEPKIMLTEADLRTECETPTYLDLNQITGETCLIDQPGCHILSGALKGTIRVDVEDQIVHLVLNGVAVDSPSGPALEVVSAGKVIITLQENSENSLMDSGSYPQTPDPDACIFVPCDLTINGSGALQVYGYYKDAIHAKDVLKVLGGSLFVQSKRDGLRGNDGIVVNCDSVTVQSEGNGLHSTKTGKDLKGNIEIYGTNCSVIGGKYAVSCAADLYIADSSVYVMGVYSDLQAGGNSYIAEGSLQDE